MVLIKKSHEVVGKPTTLMSLFANGHSEAVPVLLGGSAQNWNWLLLADQGLMMSLVVLFLDQVYYTSTDPRGGPRSLQTSWC